MTPNNLNSPAHHKVALVTGAGTGIGRAVALALLRDGWRVVLAGRRIEPLDAVAQESGTGRALAVPTDVSQPASVDALFAKIKAVYGRLDLLVNNAGVSGMGVNFEDIAFEQWQNVVNINLTGSFLCAQGAFRLMKEQLPQGGRIINNGSISAHAPRPNSAGQRRDRGGAHDGRQRSGRCGGAHGRAAAVDQHPVHDHHGHEDAVYGAWLIFLTRRASGHPAQ
jgi:NAD(P)-dependent dehydrogenase (short-subunit alcohol dehydrogenase family)